MKKSHLLSIFLFFLLFPMLRRTDYVIEGARYGLLLWYNSVVPALFPFMVLSGMIAANGGVPLIMTPVYHVLRHVLPISKDGCYVLVAGLLCGYPMGAKTCQDFVKEGRIEKNEGSFLMAICNHPSPMFLLGYAYPFFADIVSIRTFLCCIYGPIVILAPLSAVISYGCKSRRGHSAHAHPTSANTHKYNSSDSKLASAPTADETILSAVTILCKIGGYLVLFSILIVFLQHTNVLPMYFRLGLIGALEMTTGVRELAASLSPKIAWITSAAALTFGGCSGIFQTKAVLSSDTQNNEKKAGLSIRPYIFWKLLHAALSAGFAFMLCKS